MDVFNINDNMEYPKIDLNYTLTLVNIMNKLEECNLKLRDVIALSKKILHTDLTLSNGKYDIVRLNDLVDLITGLTEMRIEPHSFVEFIYYLNSLKI